jgi:hypothetical protein
MSNIKHHTSTSAPLPPSFHSRSSLEPHPKPQTTVVHVTAVQVLKVNQTPVFHTKNMSLSSHQADLHDEVSKENVETRVASFMQSTTPQMSSESFDEAQSEQLQQADLEGNGSRAAVDGLRASLRNMAAIVTPSMITKVAKCRPKTSAPADAQSSFGPVTLVHS